MRYTYFLLPLIAVLPLSAQDWEVGLFAGQQQYHTIAAAANGYSFSVTPADKTVLGIRLGYTLGDLGPASVQATLGYQPSVSTSLNISDNDPHDTVAFSSSYKESHTSAGLMFNFKALVTVGAGVELRYEKLSVQNVQTYDTSYTRPWFRAGASVDIPTSMAKAKPFLGLEMDFPLAVKNVSMADTSNSDEIRTMAPKSQFGVDLGLRF